MKHFTTFLAFGCFSAALFWGMNTSLESMTRQDCEVNNIQAACASLR
jgi:hypothetical protein